MALSGMIMERLSPMGADAKSLRREGKRRYDVATTVHVKAEPNLESPLKKPMADKPKTPKSTKNGAASSAAAKKKFVRHHEMLELQGVVDGIQQQVDAASKGIQELKELVNTHLLARMVSDNWIEPTEFVTCVSPPASLMALDQDDDDNAKDIDTGMARIDIPGCPPSDTLVYYGGGDPLPYSC